MMEINIFNLFPIRNNHLNSILKLGIKLGLSQHHIQFTLEHIIYGIMQYSCSNSESNIHWDYTYSTYIVVSDLKNIDKKKKHNTTCIIDKDVKILSSFYENYITTLSSIYPDLNENPLTLYYMILFLCRENCFSSSPVLPNAKNIYNSFEYMGFYYAITNSSEYILSQKNKIPKNSFEIQFQNTIYAERVDIKYTTDLTFLAYNNQLEKVTGREVEIQRLTNILTKMKKNNAVLIGNPGVGKTAIIFDLAQKLVTNNICNLLKNYHILEFNFAESIAGCKYRGDFEERIENLFNKILKLEKNNIKIILVFDEIHQIVNFGNAEGALSLSDMLKPILLKSNVKIIGTSTFKEYKILEKDTALERRFDTITINETTFDQTLDILTNLKSKFEENYDLKIPDSSLKTCILLSQQYITERYLPDKAINILDEACSYKINSGNETSILSPDDIAICISNQKGIPLNKIHDIHNFDNVEKELKSKVIGQDYAIMSIVQALRRISVGLNDEKKPIASFLLIGPTGVGKTEITKALAEAVFSGKDNLVRFDMSEYMSESSVSTLIGSPHGYVNHEEGGLLTEKIRRHPYSLVLFDEIEKAHPKVHNLLLQILDEGNLTDSSGNSINFKNTIIILTSNVGADEISKTPVGFCVKSDFKTNDTALSAVKKRFSPEFLNRFDEIIPFNHLSQNDIIEITKLIISRDIITKLNKKEINISISDEAIDFVAKNGYSKEYGARELKRTITTLIKNPITDFIIQNCDTKDISISIHNNQILICSLEHSYI